MRSRFVLFACAALVACGKPSPAPQQHETEATPAAPAAGANGEPEAIFDRSHAGAALPATRFDDPDGKKVSLAEFRGKPLLVNLWATWCAPCLVEMPTLDTLAGREKGRLQVVTVSQDLGDKAKVGQFFAKMKFANLKPYVDGGADLSTELKVETLPTSILYDAAGKEVWRITGKEDWGGPKAAGLLKEAVKS